LPGTFRFKFSVRSRKIAEGFLFKRVLCNIYLMRTTYPLCTQISAMNTNCYLECSYGTVFIKIHEKSISRLIMTREVLL